jgi:predicted double-glycine peptidase
MYVATTAISLLATLTIASTVSAQRAPVRDPDHIIQKRICSYQELQRRNIVMQQRDYSCGAAALATLVKFYWGDPVTEETFLNAVDQVLKDPADRLDRIKNGLTITDLRRAAVAEGYLASIGKLSIQQLRESKAPLLVGIVVDEFDHFVVYRGADDYYVYLADPARGNLRLPIWEFRCIWQKNAVLVVAKPDMDPPTWSALSVRPEERYLGALNRQMVRREMTKPPTPPMVGPVR